MTKTEDWELRWDIEHSSMPCGVPNTYHDMDAHFHPLYSYWAGHHIYDYQTGVKDADMLSS